MSIGSTKISINPKILTWARETAGVGIKDVGKLLNISEPTINAWEKGELKPTLGTIRKLSSYYNRSFATFFLPEPPYEPPLPLDLRVLPVEKKKPFSRKTLIAIRKARYVQSVATELIEEQEEKYKELIARFGKISLKDNPETVSSQVRKEFPFTVEAQQKFRSPYMAFNSWREILESFNILVYQIKVPPEEIRGLSLLDQRVPAIVISYSDSIYAKIFTLFHEFAHILLGESGICLPHEAPVDEEDAENIEIFCNHFAGAFLVPCIYLSRDKIAVAISGQKTISDSSLNHLANRFKVSKYVVLRRLLVCGFVSRAQYRNKVQELENSIRPGKAGKFKMPAFRRCLAENGKFFISMALDAKARDLITYSDLADYLSIDLKDLSKVEAKV